jgi:hypothetical protein
MTGYYVHFTPKSASWQNRVEQWFVELTQKQIHPWRTSQHPEIVGRHRALRGRHE